MARRNELENLQKKYSFVSLSQEQWEEVLNLAKEENPKNYINNFYPVLLNYLKEKGNFATVRNYLRFLAVDPELSVAQIEIKLKTFFNFLDKIDYSLTPDDSLELIQELAIDKVLKKRIGENDKLSSSVLEQFVLENDNLETLCNVYINANKIELIEEKTSNLNDGVEIIPKKLLDSTEVIELAKRVEFGDSEAKKKLVQHNLGLVRRMATRFLGRGLDYDDLFQEGVIGLMKSVDYFDYRKGYALSTYAIWWIRQAMQRAVLDQGKTIRVPVHMGEKINQLLKIQEGYKKEFDREATDEELAGRLGVSIEKIKEMKQYGNQPVSLQTPVGDDEDGVLEQFIEDVNQTVSDTAVNREWLGHLIPDLKLILNEREFKIICLRFGLLDGNTRTLDEIAVLFNLTRERIRQIEMKALRILRGNHYFRTKFDEEYSSKPVFIIKEKDIPTIQFNIKNIHTRLTPKLLRNLVKLYPQRDIEMYAKYRGINLSTGYTNPIPEKDYPENYIYRMNLIEQDLNEMVNYFYILTEKRYIRETEAYEKVKKHMIRRSMRFRYPDSTQVELVEAVKKMNKKDRDLLVLRHGKNLLEYHEYKDNKQYQAYYLAYKKLGDILNNKTEINDNDKINKNEITERFSEYTKERLIEEISLLPYEYREIIYIRFGEDLSTKNSFPKEKSYTYYYVLLKNALDYLENFLKVERKFIPSIFSKFDLEYALPLLNDEDRKIIYFRHGSNLDLLLPWPKYSNRGKVDYYDKQYDSCILKIEEILNNKQNKRESSRFVLKFEGYTYNQIAETITELDSEEQKIIYIKHGKELDEYNPYPTVKSFSYYKKLYDSAVYNLRQNLMKKYRPEEYELKLQRVNEFKNNIKLEKKNPKKRTRNSNKTLIGLGSEDDILWAISRLSELQRSTIYMRHGKNLNECLDFLNPPKDKSDNYYYSIYYAAIKRIEKLIANKESIINKPNKVVKNKRNTVIDIIKHEDLVKAVQLLKEENQKIMYMRHGDNLDQVIPWPEALEDKCDNYYYVTYSNILKKINKIIENNFEVVERKHKTKKERKYKTIIDKMEHEKLAMAVNLLNDKQKNIMYLRHGKNLDELLAWPEIPKDKSKNYYYNLYHNAIKTIEKIVANNFEVKTKKTKVKKVKTTIIDLVEHEKLELAVKQLSNKHRDVFYLRHGDDLDQVIPWPDAPEDKCSNYYYATYSAILKKINSFLSTLDEVKVEQKSIVEHKNEEKIPEEPKILKVKKKKEKKKTAIQEQRDICLQEKSNLEKLKLNNYAAEVYDKYIAMYGNIVSSNKIYNIINDTVQSYSVEEGISLEISTQFKVETAIILELANQYKENPDSDKSLEILMFLEEIIGDRIRKRYTNMAGNIPYCYISDDQISSSIEQTLSEYTGRLPFYVEVSARIKKLSR